MVVKDGVDPAGLNALVPKFSDLRGDDAKAEILPAMRVAEPFEALRDNAEIYAARTSTRPAIFVATLGPLAEHNARVDFARNLFAAGGLEAKEPTVPPTDASGIVAAFKASGCSIAVICGADKRYDDEAQAAATALKDSGAQRVWLAGKFEADSVDSHIFMGCDVVHELRMAQAELGV